MELFWEVKGEWSGAAKAADGITLGFKDNSSLTISGDAASEYLGTLEFQDGASLKFSGEAQSGWVNSTAEIKVGDADVVFTDNASGTLKTSITALNSAGASGTMVVHTGADVAIDEAATGLTLSGIQTVAAEGTGRLTLAGSGTKDAFSVFAPAQTTVVSGSGVIRVADGQTSTDGKDWTGFTGTLELDNSTLQATDGTYGFSLEGKSGATFVLEQDNPARFASMNWADGTVDLSNHTSSTNPGLSLTGNLTLGSSAVVKVHGDQVSNDIALSQNLLEQDEGIDGATIIGASGSVSVNGIVIKTGDTTLNSGITNKQIQDGVVGGYAIEAKGESGKGLLLSYKLKELSVEADKQNGPIFTLAGTGDPQRPDDNDLDVVLNGDGVIHIENGVALTTADASAFKGTLSLNEDSELTLNLAKNSAGTSAVKADFASGSLMTLVADAVLNLGEEQNSASVNLNGKTLKLAGTDNELSESFSFSGGAVAIENAALTLKDASKTIAENAQAEAVLGANGVLTLETSVDYDLKTISDNGSGALKLASGSFTASQAHLTGTNKSYKGAIDVAQGAQLTLDSTWNDGTFSNQLAGGSSSASGGTVNVEGNVKVASDNTTAFAGKWSVAGQKTLKVEHAEIGGFVELDSNATLEVAADKTAATSLVFANTVKKSDAANTGTIFKVSEGSVDASTASITVDETDVVSGATLKASSLDQLGAVVKTDGTVALKTNADLTFDKDIDDLTADSATGVFQIDLGDTSHKLYFGNASDLSGFSGKIRLINGTYTFNQADGGRDVKAGFALGSHGKFIIENADVANMTSFSWDYVAGDKGYVPGVLDLRNFTGDAAALNVDKLALTGEGQVWLDSDAWLQGLVGETQQEGNALELDNGGDGRYIITADAIDGEQSAHIAIKDKDGTTDIGANQTGTTDFFDRTSGVQGDKIAEGTWRFGATVVNSASAQNGLKLTYQLTEINLQNAADTLGAFILKANDGATGSDRVLSAKLTGEGKVNVENNVTLAGENAFAGSVNVAAGATLTTQANYGLSGNPTDTKTAVVTLQSGAGLTLIDRGAQSTQHRERIKLLTEASDVATTRISLNGGHLTLLDGSVLENGTMLDDGNTSSKTAEVHAGGTVSVKNSAKALEGYDGALHADASDAYSFIFDNPDPDEVLEITALNGASGASVLMKQNALAKDWSNYQGTIYTSLDRTLTINDQSTIHSGLRIALGASGDAYSADALAGSGTLDITSRTGTLAIGELRAGDGSVLKFGALDPLGETAESGRIAAADGANLGSGATLSVELGKTQVKAGELLVADNPNGVLAKLIATESGSITGSDYKLSLEGEKPNETELLDASGAQIGTLTTVSEVASSDNLN